MILNQKCVFIELKMFESEDWDTNIINLKISKLESNNFVFPDENKLKYLKKS